MMPVVVLSGGLATRLRPITEKVPKALIEVNGIPFVLHQLELFRQYGIEQVHYCLGYLGEKVQEVIESSRNSRYIRITYSFDGDKLLGTGGAIRKALEKLPEVFFVTYGDSFLNIDYQSVEMFFLTNAKVSDGLMTIYNNGNKYDTSNVIFKNGKITVYSKKQRLPEMTFIDFGIGILRKSHFSSYPEGFNFDLSDIYEELSVKGNLIGFESFERFYEIGSLKGIDDLSCYLKKQL